MSELSRRQLLKAGLVATAGLLLPTSVLAKALGTQNYQQLRRTFILIREMAPIYPDVRASMVEIDFMDLKKGNIFTLLDLDGTAVKDADGHEWFMATGDPYTKDWGKGPVGTIESEPTNKEDMKITFYHREFWKESK